MVRKLTVIIAEDQPADREKLEIYADRLNLKIVSSSGCGEWLIEDCLRLKPDLVLLDFALTGIDGISAYKKIIEQGVNPYLIIISGTQDFSLLLAGLELNCVDFVAKPVTFDRFQTGIEKARITIEKDILHTYNSPCRMIQVKSNYQTIYIHEKKLIYAQKVKGKHRSLIYVKGKTETVVETSASLNDIQSQCSSNIYAPNQSNLINLDYIQSMYVSLDSPGNYLIKLSYTDIEVSLARRKKKEFEQLFAKHLTNM